MKSITSVQNIKIKEITELHGAKERKQAGLFIAEGIRTIATLASKLSLVELYITEKHISQAQELAQSEQICIVSESVMQKISTATTPPGMLAIFRIPKPQLPLTAGMVLADITDPGNMGTLIRTAVACGITTLVTIEGTDPWNPKVVQATAGTIASVSIYQYTWSELLKNKNDLVLYALVVKDGDKIQSVNKQKSLLVVGNEAHGIRPEWLDSCVHTITLPMAPGTESLNAAIAGSIALYITHMGC